MILYASAYEIANHDIKSFSTLKPYNWKGFAFSGFVVGISIILFIVYKIVWMTGTLDNWGQVIGNILFLIWYLPYYCLVRPNCGAVNILGVVTAILVPVIASGIGYYAGKNQFDLSVVMKKYIYEKKK